MGLRLKNFADPNSSPVDPKARLDALALAAGCAVFPSTPTENVFATPWDKTKADYEVGAYVYGPDGGYWVCTATPPAGTALNFGDSGSGYGGTYWSKYYPEQGEWNSHMDTVRNAVAAKMWAAAGVGGPAGNCGERVDFVESCVVSGPWELAQSYFGENGRLCLTPAMGIKDSAGANVTVYPYGMTQIELLSQASTCRLDIVADLGGGQILTDCFSDARSEFHLERGLNFPAYVRGYVTLDCETLVEPPEDISLLLTIGGGGTYCDNRQVIWVWGGTVNATTGEVTLRDDDGDLVSAGIGIEASIMPGDYSVWHFSNTFSNLVARWPGSAAATAANVISSVDVYRSLGRDPRPRVSITTHSVADDYSTVQSSLYANGANAVPMYAVPVNYSPDDAQWRLRAKTFPSANIYYAEIPASSFDVYWQRQWYPCRRLDLSATLTPTTTQGRIRELDTVWGKRNLKAVDQTRPVIARDATQTTRAVVGGTVGYKRTGDVDLRPFSAGALLVLPSRMEHENYLGRSSAIIVWEPLTLLWDGADIVVSATGPIGVWSPNAITGWVWGGGGGWSTTTLSYYYCAHPHYDDLAAVLRIISGVGATPVGSLPAVDQLGQLDPSSTL